MILNDVFDVEKDRGERPSRPIPAGLIPLRQAKVAGWGLLVVGVGLAGLSGYLPSQQAPATWLPAAVGLLLAIMIVAYDGPLKANAAGTGRDGSLSRAEFLAGGGALSRGGCRTALCCPSTSSASHLALAST